MINQEPADLPIWLYWEGDLPDWIRECQKTVFAHGTNVQLLTPESFREMRNTDLDIRLEDLCIAHRADFIRAFLLARHGGLWIDSDCVVIKSLKPLMDALNNYDFLGYRERSGEVTNNLMGASKNSIIAANYYNLVCSILRDNKPIEWLTLGSKALTSTLNESSASWCELTVEQIQPVCWSKPEEFLQERTDEEHQYFINRTSYCYMLSANMIGQHISDNPNKNILNKYTFFSYLLRMSVLAEENYLTVA